MVNVEKVYNLLNNLESALGQLRQLGTIDREKLLTDGLVLGAAKYYLQTAIEACIDIGNHIISSERYRSPRDYRDVFTVLQENDIVDEDLAIRLRQMAGLRNRLVHLYWEIDDALIYAYLQSNLGDFEAYMRWISDFLKGVALTQ
jgi:uncharacterized protein YutE (UPF0331/DUF86 family)